MASNLAAPPLQTGLIESATKPYITRVWNNWFQSVVERVAAAAYRVASPVAITNGAASIPATDLLSSPVTGLYRITYRFRVTQAATVSSSLILTVTATDGGVACALATAAYTGNAVNQPQTGTVLVRSDNGAPITYAFTYASVGGVPMIYSGDILVEAM